MENTRISRERFFCQAAFLGVAYGTARYRNVPITRQAALPFAFSTIFQLGSLHLKGLPNKKTYANLLSAFSFALMADGLRKLDMPVRSKVLSGGLLGGVQLVIVNYSLPERTGSLPREENRQVRQPTSPLTLEVGVQPQVSAQKLSLNEWNEKLLSLNEWNEKLLSSNEWNEKLLSSNEWLEKLFKIFFERFDKKNSRKFDMGNKISFARYNEKFLQRKKEEFYNRLICGPDPERPRTILRFSQLLHDKLINNDFPYETPEEFWNRFANEPLEREYKLWIVPKFIKTKEDFQYLSEIKLPKDLTEDFKQCDVVRFSDLPNDRKESFQTEFINLVSRAKDTKSEAMQIYLTEDLRELHCVKFTPGGKVEGVYLCKNTILLTYKDKKGEFSLSKWTLDFNDYVFELNQVKTNFNKGIFELVIKLFKPVGPTV